jgi:polar amino acid transport system substrate-binding protein
MGRLLWLVAMLCCWTLLPVGAGAETIVFCTINQDNSRLYKVSDAVLTEAFRRLGYEFRLVTYPAKRGPVEVNAGRVDGGAHRIHGFNNDNRYPNLVRVDESIQAIDQSVFARSKTIQVNGWESLADYEIVYLAGIKVVETGMDRAGIPKNRRIPVYTIDRVFELLSRGRGDLTVVSASTGRATMEKLGISSERIHLLSPPVVVIELYSYMHKRHRPLAKALGAVLKEMKGTGRHQQLVDAVAE